MKKVQNYILGKLLGKGTFGNVYEGMHCLTSERVAIKAIVKEKIKCEEDVNRIGIEIKVMKLLHHQYIAKLLETIETGRTVYLIIEFVPNGELNNYVTKQIRLSEKDACRIFRQLVLAVHYCHNRKICHRDLKMENILVDQDNNIKIIDFGLSNILQKDYELKTSCGTPTYTAPEMLKFRKYDGPGVDIWACGVILYVMLVGLLPFYHEDQSEMYRMITMGKFDFPEQLKTSEAAKDLVKKILVVEPTKRYTLVNIMEHEWFLNCIDEPFVVDRILEKSTINIDFYILAAMQSKLKNLRPDQAIKYLQNNNHNSTTAFYYLLLERKKKSNPEYKWQYNDQRKYANALGYSLNEDGTFVVSNEKCNEVTDPHIDCMSALDQMNQCQSEGMNQQTNDNIEDNTDEQQKQ